MLGFCARRTKDLVKPDPEKYTVRVPEGLSAMDIDVIKLTAQFVARNGRSFLQEIANRESRNPLFNFLRPTHSLHGYFTSLADAYARVLIPPKVAISRLEEDMADRTKIMERCLRRLEFDKALDRCLSAPTSTPRAPRSPARKRAHPHQAHHANSATTAVFLETGSPFLSFHRDKCTSSSPLTPPSFLLLLRPSPHTTSTIAGSDRRRSRRRRRSAWRCRR